MMYSETMAAPARLAGRTDRPARIPALPGRQAFPVTRVITAKATMMDDLAPRTMLVAAPDSGTLTADFESVVRTFRPVVFRFALASLRDRDAAETIAQDCFLKAFNSRVRSAAIAR
jgi:hypothetical protein